LTGPASLGDNPLVDLPIAPAAVPRVTRDDIVAGLRRVGLNAGAGVAVHSSLRGLGCVVGPGGTPLDRDGAARTVIDALVEVLTPDGTLMMPSFNHGAPFADGGAGFYDPLTTPTTNGTIPELFRRLPGVHRSLDPTHPVAAWGKHARRYTQFHHRTLTMGPGSPLGLLGREGGLCLLIGVGYKVNTYHHVVETTLGAPCVGPRTEAYPVRLGDGRVVQGRGWGWRERGCPIDDGARYGRLMESRGLQRETMIGAARVILFRLSDCFEVVAEALRDGLDGFPPCAGCPIRPRRAAQTVPSDWDDQTSRPVPNSVAWTY
jgi:aminoglycoside 3-N-acetyltransferase